MLTFSDDFQYPNGNLVGEGQWIADDSGNDTPLVLSHAAIPGPVGSTDAGVADVLTLPQVVGDWWIEFVATLTQREAAMKSVDVWIGSQLDSFAGMLVEFSTGILAAGQARFTYGGNTAGFHQKTVTVGDFNAPHTFAVVYKAAGQTMEIWFDGVLQDSSAGLDLSDIVNPQLQLYFVAAGIIANPNVSYIEVGVGHYS